MSKESETLLSVVLTDCPPGPEERENFQDSSDAGITIPRRISRSSAMVARLAFTQTQSKLLFGGT